jgi:type VI secretion system secreted protein VgrG
VSSVNGKVEIAAAKELILECGGAFIQLKDGNITLGGPLDLLIKTITIQKQGAASFDTSQSLPEPGDFCLTCFLRAALTGSAVVRV